MNEPPIDLRAEESGQQTGPEGSSAELAAERINRLLRLGAALSEALTMSQVAQLIVNEGVTVLGASAGAIVILDPLEEVLEMLHTVGYRPEAVEKWLRMPIDADVPIARAVREGRAIWIGSRTDMLRETPELSDEQLGSSRSFACLPLIVDGVSIGGMALSFDEERAFSQEDRDFAMLLARQCSGALERGRLYDAERHARAAAEEARHQIAFLSGASEILTSTLDFNSTIESLVRLAVPTLADWCAVHVANDAGEVTSMAFADSDPEHERLIVEIMRRFPSDASDPRGIGGVISQGRSLFIPELEPERRDAYAVDDEHRELIRRIDVRSIIIVPLVVRERTLGALSLSRGPDSPRYDGDDLAIAEELGIRAALAIDNARLYQGVRDELQERKRAEEALRASEERYRTLFEMAPDVIYSISAEDGTITSLSPSFEALTGWPPEEWIGRPFAPIVHPDDLAKAFHYFGVVLSGEAPPPYELRVASRSGEYLVGEFRSRPRIEDGRVVGAYGIARDITRRKDVERELRQAWEAAESANAAKDQFLAILSHELRTPLTPVLATVEAIVEDKRFDVGLRPLVEIIRRNAEQEAHLIDDLLDLTRIARGKIQLQFDRIDVDRFLRETLESFRSIAVEKGVGLVEKLIGEPIEVSGDASRLQQVFWNLLQNAIKFTPSGGTITLRLDRSGGHATIEVIDTGMGVEPEVLPRIFNAFEQGDDRVTRQFGGLGLGLAICKALVEMHGGTIAAYSGGPGTGATFTVRLPIVDAVEAHTADQPERSASTEQSNSAHILLVDDHRDTSLVMRMLLERDGYRVTTAHSVEEALDAASHDRFDLLLSDIGLPDGSGLDLMRRLHEQGILLKGIACSGYGMDEDLERSREAGFIEHLTKPIGSKQLKEAVTRAMGSRTEDGGRRTEEED